VVSTADLAAARAVVHRLYVDDKVKDYVVSLVLATRDPRAAGLADLAPLVEWGASPRATLWLLVAARAHAFLRHRAFVTPEDVKAVAPDVLRHRISLTYEAEAEDVTPEKVVARVLERVEVP
jgi:MoxR-like ATPase